MDYEKMYEIEIKRLSLRLFGVKIRINSNKRRRENLKKNPSSEFVADVKVMRSTRTGAQKIYIPEPILNLKFHEM